MIFDSGFVGDSSSPDVGDIGHSLRFRASGTTNLSRTFAAGGNQATWAFFAYFKRSRVGSNERLLYCGNSGSFETYIGIVSDAVQIEYYDGTNDWYVRSSNLLRDPAAFVALMVVADTTNAVAADRFRIYIDGVRVTSFAATNYPNQNTLLYINSTAYAHYIGMRSNSTDSLDGNLARVCFIGGYAPTDMTDFGYLNSTTNKWTVKTQTQIKAVVDAGGTNSCMLDFDNGTSLTTLGYDKSSKGNNWTLNNFSLTGVTNDWTTDVPGGSCCVLNNAGNTYGLSAGAFDIRNAGMTLYVANNSGYRNVDATWVPEGTKGYIEITHAGTPNAYLGVQYQSIPANSNSTYTTTGTLRLGAMDGNVYNGSTLLHNIGMSAVTGDVTRIAYDFTNGKRDIWFGLNANWGNNGSGTGNPETGANPSCTAATLTSPCRFFFSSNSGGGAYSMHFNFGQQPYAYTPPAGFGALKQSNLPTPAILNPTSGFVTVTGTKANILTTLAAARSGWDAYVDIIKNTAAAESWGWRFSALAGNEYTIAAGAVAYQANRAMSGTDAHSACSIRIGAAFGTAAGTVAHTNGTPDTVTHALGVSARQMILLFPRAGGTSVKVYHPDCTAGKLLDLCSTAAEATDGTITSVTSSSFQVAASLATGTYDYLVISEISGFFKLSKFTGTASADGPWRNYGHRPAWVTDKAIGGTSSWHAFDAARSPSNPVSRWLWLDSNLAENTTVAAADFNASGSKIRHDSSTYPINGSSIALVCASFAAVAGKYS